MPRQSGKPGVCPKLSGSPSKARSLADIEDGEEVFVIRATQEIFDNYEDYIAQLELYRQPVWTCNITNRNSLTYEEAVLSEAQAVCRAQEFPDSFVEEALHLLHKSQLKRTEIVDKICDYFVHNCAVGEVAEGVWHVGPNAEERSGKLAISAVCPLSATGERSYVVRWESAPEGEAPPTILPHSQIRARKQLPRKAVKHFIRKVASRAGYPGAPLLAKTQYCKQYNLPMDWSHKERRKRAQPATQKADSRKTKKAKPNTEEKLEPLPPFITDVALPQHCMGDLLMIHSFLSTFRGVLRLQNTFSLDDLVEVLSRTGHTALLESVHMILMKMILPGYPSLLRYLTPNSWQVILRKWAKKQHTIALSGHMLVALKGNLHHTLSPVDKITLLAHLCNAALDSTPIREYLEGKLNDSVKLEREVRISSPALKSDEENSSNEPAAMNPMALLREERFEEAASGVRSSCLGRDRQLRRYWWWKSRRGGSGKARMWVETLSPNVPPYPPAEDKETEGDTDTAKRMDSIWGFYDTEEQVEALVEALGEKNGQEKHLKKKLLAKQSKIASAMRRPISRFRIPVESNAPVRRSSRLQAKPENKPANNNDEEEDEEGEDNGEQSEEGDEASSEYEEKEEEEEAEEK